MAKKPSKQKLAARIPASQTINAMSEMVTQRRLDELVAEVASGKRKRIAIDDVVDQIVVPELSERWH